jgi:integrase
MAIVPRRKKNGSVTFQVRVKDANGSWYPTPSYEHLDQAVAEEARLMGLKRKGRHAFGQDAKRITVQEFWDVWSVENRTNTSEGWKISQDQMFRDYVTPVIGQLKMSEVDAPWIGKIFARMKKMGRGEQTRKHAYSLVRQMFQDAVEYYEMLAANPVKAKHHRPKVRQVERSFLEPAQAFYLLDNCRDKYFGPAIWLQTLAALRVSEAQALRIDSIQYERSQILICSAYNNKTNELQPYPKQEDWALVPMIDALRDYIRSLGRKPGEFVCQGPRGGMLSYETYCRALPAFCKKLGLPAVTTHELRHSSSEIWVQAGASQVDIQRLLNHESSTTTARYMHRTDSRLQGLAGKVGQSFPIGFPNGKKETFATPEGEVKLVH